MATILPTTSASHASAYATGALVMVLATAVILAALGFEYIGHYLPCPLCLQQRYAYYAGIPAAFVGLVMLSSERPRLTSIIFAMISLAFLANAGLGIYQAGAEWKFWPGPQSCGTIQALGGASGGLLDKLDATKVIKCDEAQWRFAELSFAGWNVVASLILAGLAAKAAWPSAQPRYRSL